jgi:hypothetical protein
MAIMSLQDRPAGPTPIEVDISGPAGNAYRMLALAADLCRQLKYDSFRTECILEEMKLTDYEGLLYTFDREFGLLVTLWR